ncbi:MAG: hypothetical protein CMJ83_03530 [Planctomycetes bacterium]|nr:hypothetical protein [Planctomycetota bacterium]
MKTATPFLLWLLSTVVSAQEPDAALTEGFESLKAGPLDEVTSMSGTWRAPAGHAEIDGAHHRTGRHCLHLHGGERHRAVYVPHLKSKRPRLLTFWAERWTRRDPFSFVVHAKGTRGRWTEIYRGDGKIAVGGFKTRVRVPLPRTTASIRFTCTSPEKSGVLIDDLVIAPTIRMEVTAEMVPYTAPVLVGAPWSPVARLNLRAKGNLTPAVVSELEVDLAGTSFTDVARVAVFATGSIERVRAWVDADAFKSAHRIGPSQGPANKLVFRGKYELEPGDNWFWVAMTPRATADLGHRVQARVRGVKFETRSELRLHGERPMSQRLGVAVRKQGHDLAHTYRIPGLATTPKGTLIAVYDVRRKRGGDLPGDVDVGMSRSRDGGRNWEPMKVIMHQPDEPGARGNGIGDPAILVDRKSGRIWVAATWSHGNRAWRGSGPGLQPKETGQLLLTFSEDDGRTWRRPINITAKVKKPEWCYLLQGPGKGITMRDGTLVFAAQYQDAGRLPFSTILYSHDRGSTWHIGTGAKPNTTESQVVELEDGVLMLNMRDNRGGKRSVYVTHDMGKTWKAHQTSRKALDGPVCMASLIRVDELAPDRADRRLLFSNPAVSKAPRRHLSIKASADHGMTWGRPLLLDAGYSAGYSCLTMIDAETVGILYEGSVAHLVFQRIPLADILRR